MVTYTMPQQRKKEESKRLRGEKYQIKFTDLGFERYDDDEDDDERYDLIRCAITLIVARLGGV